MKYNGRLRLPYRSMWGGVEVELEKLITYKCMLCGVDMVPDKYDFYRCPSCDSEFWPKAMALSENKQIRKAFAETTYISRSLVGTVAPGGSSKNGRAKKEAMKKQPPQKIYERLFKQT